MYDEIERSFSASGDLIEDEDEAFFYAQAQRDEEMAATSSILVSYLPIRDGSCCQLDNILKLVSDMA